MTEELKPCPFCGNMPDILVVNLATDNSWIVCSDAGCAVSMSNDEDSLEDKINKWNRRA